MKIEIVNNYIMDKLKNEIHKIQAFLKYNKQKKPK